MVHSDWWQVGSSLPGLCQVLYETVSCMESCTSGQGSWSYGAQQSLARQPLCHVTSGQSEACCLQTACKAMCCSLQL